VIHDFPFASTALRRELNPPQPITTHRHSPSVKCGGKASRAFVVGRGVDEFDKQIASVAAAATSPKWASVAFNWSELWNPDAAVRFQSDGRSEHRA
jgi:hypothetical protein